MLLQAVDQTSALLTAFLGPLALALPERRPADVVTLAHSRAAERLHRAASWLLRGADLLVVKRRTPFLAEDSQDLWQYYEGLPLDSRPELLVAGVLIGELLESTQLVTREQHPRLRRLLDIYAAAVGVASLVPRRIFFHLHRIFWHLESAKALGEAREPQMPLPLSAENQATLTKWCGNAWALVTGDAHAPPSRGLRGAGGGSSWTPWLLLSMVGVGAAAWWLGPDGRRRAYHAASDIGVKLLDQAADVSRGLLEPPGPKPPPQPQGIELHAIGPAPGRPQQLPRQA